MKKVSFLAKEMLGWVEKGNNIISIGSSAEAPPALPLGEKRLLRLEFDDIEQDMGKGYQMFDFTHAVKIFKFIEECGEEDIVVHCEFGVSRSAAVAKFMNDFRGYFLDLWAPGSCGTTKKYNKEVYRILRLHHIQTIPLGAPLHG